MDISIDINPDGEGYTGRECPVCEKYFKIKFGTGLPGSTDCHCPYCNNIAPQDHYMTKQQIEYAKTVALNVISKQMISRLKKYEHRADLKALISIGITVKGNPFPITYYSEKDLEEIITCTNCNLQYSIYGTFGFCPDCGVHNSLQIVKTNFDLIIKILDLSAKGDSEIANRLIENALEDAVSCFDGFGREQFARLPYKISFQNIEGAKEVMLREIGYDISASMSTGDWGFVREQFQKRHLIAHKMGVIDAGYALKTGASPSMIGRKIVISRHDVEKLILLLNRMAENLYKNLRKQV